MNVASIYHRPESEYAYLIDKDTLALRLRTEKEDVATVEVTHGDTYTLHSRHWYKQTEKMTKICTTDCHDYWEIAISEATHRAAYAFILTDFDGNKIFYGDHGFFSVEEKYLKLPNNYFKLPYFHEIDRFKIPEWVTKTVWYQIFPERFANGDASNDPVNTLAWGIKDPDRQDFFGGDLEGVLEHLDYLVDLGINGIYFCPIFEGESNHKYDTIDYLKVDPAFGSDETFKKVVNECHKRGIKVMLDAVFNHIGDTSPMWQDVIQNGKNSRYADWFHIHDFPVSYKEGEHFEDAAELNYDVFAFTPHMPKWNTANPEVEAYLLTIAKYWIETFDIDAWRLDVANEVDHRFWKNFRKVCDATKEDFYILGEIWHSSQSWLVGDEFHAVMNYAFTDTVKEFFIKKDISMKKMVSELNSQLMLYREPTNRIMFNCLDSHDTPRLLTECEENKDLMKQLIAFTYLQQGVPCLYYGDEIGMTGGMDPDCRKCMEWDEEKQDRELFDFMKKMIAIRKENVTLLSNGKLDWCVVNEEDDILQFQRKLGDKQLIATFNTGKKAAKGDLRDIQLANQATIDGTNVTIEPNGFVISVG